MPRPNALTFIAIAAVLAFGPAAILAQSLADDLNAEHRPPQARTRADGVVVGPDGPVANVTVILEVQNMGTRRIVGSMRTKTAVDGSFSFDLTPYRMSEYGLEFSTQSPRFRQALQILRVRDENLPTTVQLEVVPGSSVTGIVLDEKGKPLEKTAVEFPGMNAARTDENGRYELFGLPASGTIELRVHRTGYTAERFTVETDEPKLLEAPTITLKAAASLSGRVLDPLGKPVAGGSAIFRTTETFFRADVAKDGTFEWIAVPVEREGAIVEYLSNRWLPVRRELKGDEATTTTIEFRVEPGVLFGGVVTDPNGNPAGGAYVTIGDNVSARAVQVQTQPDGRWECGPFPFDVELPYTVTPPSRQPVRAPGEFAMLKEDPPGTWTAEVNPWPRGHRNSFVVKIADRQVTMERRDSGAGGFPGLIRYTGTFDPVREEISGTVSIEETSGTGTFLLRKYDKKTRTLRGDWDLREEVALLGTPLGPARGTIRSGALPGRRIVELALTESYRLAGIVLGEDGEPITRGTVMVVEWEGGELPPNSAPIQAGGAFLLEGLPEGVVSIVAIDEAGELAVDPSYVRTGVEGFVLRADIDAPDPMD